MENVNEINSSSRGIEGCVTRAFVTRDKQGEMMARKNKKQGPAGQRCAHGHIKYRLDFRRDLDEVHEEKMRLWNAIYEKHNYHTDKSL